MKFSFRRFHALALIVAVACFAAPIALPTAARAADISITAGSVLPSAAAKFKTGTSGATITAGQTVYLDPVTNSWKLADANGASPLYKVAGIAVNGASSGQWVRVCYEDPAFTLGGTVAAGAVIVQSATAGGIAPVGDLATGHFTSVLGIGVGSNKVTLSILRADVAVP